MYLDHISTLLPAHFRSNVLPHPSQLCIFPNPHPLVFSNPLECGEPRSMINLAGDMPLKKADSPRSYQPIQDFMFRKCRLCGCELQEYDLQFLGIHFLCKISFAAHLSEALPSCLSDPYKCDKPKHLGSRSHFAFQELSCLILGRGVFMAAL